MKPALVIMAAGLGSRYGGLKQIDPIGPQGEILIEFAISDMISFWGEKVVCIVSEAIKSDFETIIVEKYREKINIELIVQSIEKIPEFWFLNFDFWAKRSKPWGTGHAVWCAREVLKCPFIVINADDFYWRKALRQAYTFLLEHEWESHCVITYPLKNTLSLYGTVSRGICEVVDNKLIKILEHTKVGYHWDTIVHTCQDGHEVILNPQAPTNMNLFGFQRSFLDLLNQECIKFFEDYAQDETREFFLPSVVMEMIVEKKGEIYALPTSSEWFGMTYPEDRAQAKETIKKILSA